jgi:hypothetical protein
MMGDELRLRHRCPSGRPPWEGTGHVIITGGSSEEVSGGGQQGVWWWRMVVVVVVVGSKRGVVGCDAAVSRGGDHPDLKQAAWHAIITATAALKGGSGADGVSPLLMSLVSLWVPVDDSRCAAGVPGDGEA